jgi:nitrogen fixation NifU-like protein
MQLIINANKIEEARFRGEGCAISIAMASMLTEFSKGKSVSQIKSLGDKELIKLLGTDPGPARIECALLGLEVMKAAIDAQQDPKVSETSRCDSDHDAAAGKR